MFVDVNFDLSELDARLSETEARAKRLTPAFRDLRRPMARDQRQHAREQRGPDQAWPPRSPFTEERRRARNRRTRMTKAARTIAVSPFRRRSTPKRILGRLPNAIIIESGPLYVRARSRAPAIARAQQLGLRVGRRRKVRLPARRFLWASDPLIEVARVTLGAYVVKGMKK